MYVIRNNILKKGCKQEIKQKRQYTEWYKFWDFKPQYFLII